MSRKRKQWAKMRCFYSDLAKNRECLKRLRALGYCVPLMVSKCPALGGVVISGKKATGFSGGRYQRRNRKMMDKLVKECYEL